MANTYKNIVITPSRSSNSDDPKIVFSGANTTTNTDITLRMYPTSNGTLSLEGSAGQLFSVTNDLTGTIYSVNDVSGIPSIEVLSSGLVKIAQYSGPVVFGSNTSTITNYGNVVVGSTTVINSTGYWVGPSPTTITGPMTITGNGSYVGDHGYSTLILQDSNGYPGLNYRSGSYNWLMRMDNSGSYSMYYSTNAYTGAGSYGTYFTFGTGGTGTATSDWRAPIFYDSNNTGYYTDPASTSNLNQINMQGFLRRNTSAAGYMEGNYPTSVDGNSSAAIYTIGGGYQPATTTLGNMYGVGYTVGNGTANPGLGQNGWGFYVAANGTSRIFLDSENGVGIASASFRAPIFYDSDNPAYYGDLGNSGISINTAGSIRGSYYVASNYGSTGYTQYKGYDNNNHFIVIRGYVGGNTSTPSITGGHATTFVEYAETNDSTGWFFRTAGTGNYDIVSRITRSYSSFEGSARAPIFYDSNNNAYYVDPASTSIVNSINATALTGDINNMPFNGNGISGMGPATTWDARPGPVYDRYAINWHTGISLSGYPSYGGVRLYSAGYPTLNSSTLRLEASSGVYTYGQFTNDNRVDAPIFYDSNNTGYYLDPNAGTSLNVAGAIQAGGNITAYYSDERLKTKLGPIENAIDKVKTLDGFYYQANEVAQKLGYKVKRELGLSAQQVQAILPEIVAPAPIDNRYLTIHYERVVPLLVEAIKELNHKHETEIAELKQALAALLNKQ